MAGKKIVTEAKIKAWVKTGVVSLAALACLTFLSKKISFVADIKKYILG